MTGFTYVPVERILPIFKGKPLTDATREALANDLWVLSTKLSGRFIPLRARWEADPPDSPLRNHVEMMIYGAMKKTADNPNGFSGESIGPFGYSRFESMDPGKIFDADDLAALGMYLAGRTPNQPMRTMQTRGYVGPAPLKSYPWRETPKYFRERWGEA